MKYSELIEKWIKEYWANENYGDIDYRAIATLRAIAGSMQKEEEAASEKTLGNTDVNGAHKNVPDIQVFGNGDMFQLLCKASSQAEGWMKSTKAMEIPEVGCAVQVTTQQRNPDGSYAVAEALTFVPGVEIEVVVNPDTGEVRGRELRPIARPAVSGLNSGYWHRRAEIMEMYARQIINVDEARAMLGVAPLD